MTFKRAFGVRTYVLASFLLLGAAPATAGSFTWTTLDFPGQLSGAAAGINDANQVAGYFFDSASKSHGFIWSAGTFTQVDFTGTTGGSGLAAINDSGVAVGSYFVKATRRKAYTKGFSYTLATGAQKLLKVEANSTVNPLGINASGQIVGAVSKKPVGSPTEGFLVSGRTTTLLSVAGAQGTQASGINDSGTVVGWYGTSTSAPFFTYAGGTYTTINLPDGGNEYLPPFITNAGVIGGDFRDSSGLVHGITINSGTTTTYDFPGASSTGVNGIGPGGEVAGTFATTSNGTHAFVLTGGTYYQVDPPGAIASGVSQVNSSGSLVGSYVDGSAVEHAFIAVCPTGQSPCTQ